MANDDLIDGFDDEKDESLKLRLEEVKEVEEGLIVHLTGYIDTYNSSYFQKRIQKVIEAGYNRLIFQCEGLNYVSSTGVGSFTSFLKALKARSGDLVLLAIQPKVYEVFQLLGFAQFFNIKETIESAVSFFKKGSSNDEDSIFPKVFACPICAKKLKALKPGRFRCSECKTILAIDNAGQVFLG